MAKKTTGQLPECALCHEPIEDKTLPVNHSGSTYCPQCFAHVVAPASGGLFACLVAAKCQRCEAVFLATSNACPQCKYRVLQALPRK